MVSCVLLVGGVGGIQGGASRRDERELERSRVRTSLAVLALFNFLLRP